MGEGGGGFLVVDCHVVGCLVVQLIGYLVGGWMSRLVGWLVGCQLSDVEHF